MCSTSYLPLNQITKRNYVQCCETRTDVCWTIVLEYAHVEELNVYRSENTRRDADSVMLIGVESFGFAL